jgi:adenine-specific DNA-methyltransferase
MQNGNGPARAYRHKGEKRTNIPPAAIAAEGRVPAAPSLQYSYSPRLDPVLRFDASGAPDKLPELLEKAKREPLTGAEAQLLAEALRRYDPWLEWAGKREANGFAVDPVARRRALPRQQGNEILAPRPDGRALRHDPCRRAVGSARRD